MLPAFSFRRNSKLSNVLRNFSCYNKDWGTDMIKAFCALFSFFFFLPRRYSSVQLLSRVWLFVTAWTTACQAFLSINNSWILLKLMSIELVMPSNHFILCCPLVLLPSIFPSIRVFSNVSTLRIRWPKDWSFSLSISPSNEHSRQISFRIDCLDLLALQGTLKSLLQHHFSKSTNSSMLNFLYSPTVTCIHEYWKNHSFD